MRRRTIWTLSLLPVAALLVIGARLWLTRPEPVPASLPSSSFRVGADAEPPRGYPSDWQWLRRTAPYWQVDPVAGELALAHAQAMQRAVRGIAKSALSPVTLAGPTNIGGRVVDIEYHPTNGSIAYAAAATGGVYKTLDGGANWFPVGDALPNLNAGDLAIDPVSPQTVWLGTGEPNGGHNNFPGQGVYRSLDGGGTWQFMGLGNSVTIGRIVIDPFDPQRVFVAAMGSYFSPTPERGLYRTSDGGLSWQRVLAVSDSAGAIDVVIDPTNSQRMLAATWERVRRPNGGTHLFGPGSGIWRSLDGGTTWTKLGAAQGLPNPAATNVGRIGLALSRSQPNVAYAVITNGNNVIGLWRTADFGTTWVNRDSDLEIQAGGGGFSWYFSQVRVAPNNPDRVYVQDVTFFRSDDGGTSFPIKYGYTGSPPGLHVDHHALAFHPADPNVLLEGNDGGINRSVDGGTTWTKVLDLPLTQFYEIGLDRTNSARLYGGAQDNGTVRTQTGALGDWGTIFGGDGFYVNVHPVNPDTIYAESQFGNLGRSADGGLNWVTVTPSGAASDRKNWSTPVRLDPARPNVVYYGTQRLWRSNNAGASWTAVSPDLTGWVPGAVLGTITSIAVAPSDSRIVWLGTDDGKVWRGVETAGVFAWTNVTAGNLPPRWVTRVVAHPTDATRAWVTFSGLKWMEDESHVFATLDAGASWSDVSSNLPRVPINAMAVDPANAQLLFVGTDLGAYYSDNGGGIWNYLSAELPLVTVYDLAIHPVARYLAIGSYGRSMYKMPLSAFTAAPGAGPPAGVMLAQNAPNPVRGGTRIAFTLASAGHARLTVFDAAGRRVRVVLDASLAAGEHAATWDGLDAQGRAVAGGSYRYRLETSGGSATRALVVLR